MKQYKFKYLTILAIALILVSCKKSFLNDVNGNNRLIRQDYVVDLKTTNEFLSGIYINVGTNLAGVDALIYPELVADNIRPVSGTNSFYINFYQWNQRADETNSTYFSELNANGLSYSCYQIIRSCNFAIERANMYKEQNPELGGSILGQAYGIRAFAYTYLLNYFAQQYNFTNDGSHPGVAITVSSNITEPLTKRSSVKDVYQLIISDLRQALAMPMSEVRPQYFTKNAAMALLSRAYLNIGDYNSAKNWAREMIKVKPLMTINYPAALFTANDSEVIFLAPPGNSSSTINSHSTFFQSSLFRSAPIQMQATRDIADLLTEDPNDKRKSWVTKTGIDGWQILKYPENVVPGFFNPADSYNQTLIRSSEMYLIAAESYASLNRVDSAQYFLDQVRFRANPTAIQTNETGSALMSLIYKERRKELAFEGFRMFDLLRWKKGVIRQDIVPGSPKELPYPSDKAIAPIPGIEVKTLGFEQNKGY